MAAVPPVEAVVGAELHADGRAAESLAAAFAALAAGDLDAIETVYDACAPDLFGLALWRTGSREDAADVVQEVFVRLAAGSSGLGRVRKPRAYLLAMGHSAAVDILRRRKITVEADDAVLEPVRPDPVTAADAARASRLVPGSSGGAARGRLPAPLRRPLVRRDRRRDGRADVHGGEPVPARDRAAAQVDGGGAMNDELFRGMKPASAPAGLRDRALRAARAAAGRARAREERAGVRLHARSTWRGRRRCCSCWRATCCSRRAGARTASWRRAGMSAVVDTRADRDDRQLARSWASAPR